MIWSISGAPEVGILVNGESKGVSKAIQYFGNINGRWYWIRGTKEYFVRESTIIYGYVRKNQTCNTTIKW